VRKPKKEKYAYDARVPLWPSRDPNYERGGLNLYAYVENKPIDFIDLLGLQGKGACIKSATDTYHSCMSTCDMGRNIITVQGLFVAVAEMGSGFVVCGIFKRSANLKSGAQLQRNVSRLTSCKLPR